MHRLSPSLSQPYSRSCLYSHVQIVRGIRKGAHASCITITIAIPPCHLAIAGTFCTIFVGEIPARSFRTTHVGDGVVVADVAVVLLLEFVVAFVAFLGGGR